MRDGEGGQAGRGVFPGLHALAPFGVRLARDGAVQLSPGLKSYSVFDATGAQVATICGLLLAGWAGPGLSVREAAVLADFPVPDEATLVRRVLYALHGMFVAVSQAPLPRRLYLDFGGAIPMMWDAESGLVGSSADQLLDDAAYERRFLAARHARMIASEGHGWITGTLTAHAGVHRLMPGHALDLNSLVAHRVWPLAGELALDLGLEEAAATAGDAIRGFVVAAASELDCAITLTAGFDSRILLAAARPVKDRLGFVTFGAAGEGLDQDMSAKLARTLGLGHRLVPIADAAEADQALWDRRVGHAMREVNRRIHPTLAAVPHDVVLTGMYGEVGRARLYRQDIASINDRPATAEFVLSRLTLPLEPEQVADVARWVEGLSWMPRSMVLDMAFNELKFGSWAMGQAPAQKAVKTSLMPFAQAAVQAAFLRTPPAVKGTEALFRRMGELLWPDAMQLPVNRYGDWRDRMGKFAKLTKRESVVRFLRDRLAN